MVGRTPEFLGKKIEAREVKIAAFIAILHLIDIVRTALASYFAANDTAMGYWFYGNATGWLNNPGITDFRKCYMNILQPTTVLI
jgi:K+-transporting ATPase ATPase A chain